MSVRLGDADAVAGFLEQAARTAQIGGRPVETVQSDAGRAARRQGVGGLARGLAAVQTVQRRAEVALGRLEVRAAERDLAAHGLRTRLQQRIGAHGGVVQQPGQSRFRLVEAAAAEIDLGQAVGDLRAVALRLGNRLEDRARGVEFVREQGSLRLLQALFGRDAFVRVGRNGAAERGQQQVGASSRGLDHVGVLGLDVVKHAADAGVEFDLPVRRRPARLAFDAGADAEPARQFVPFRRLDGRVRAAQREQHVFARRHRQARRAQPLGDQVHRTQAHPAGVARRIDGERQHGDGGRVRRRGDGRRLRTLAQGIGEHGGSEQHRDGEPRRHPDPAGAGRHGRRCGRTGTGAGRWRCVRSAGR